MKEPSARQDPCAAHKPVVVFKLVFTSLQVAALTACLFFHTIVELVKAGLGAVLAKCQLVAYGQKTSVQGADLGNAA